MTRRRTRRWFLDRLEPREVPVVNPLGSEFIVHQAALGVNPAPSVGRDAVGSSVVVWQAQSADGGTDIFARRFAPNGSPLGEEFRVNSFTAGNQSHPDVAVDADGDFVVVWHGDGPAGTDSDIYARRYDRLGTPSGAQFLVNATTPGPQTDPRVSADRAGNFVVAWTTRTPGPGSTDDISFRRFDSTGTPLGGEVRANSFLTGHQSKPDVALAADGQFLVVWQSEGQDGDGWGVYGRRYRADGNPIGPEFRVNSFTTGRQELPVAGRAANGDFVVAWQGSGVPGGQGQDVYVRRFRADQVDLGTETIVNQFTLGDQSRPAIAVAAEGDFVVTWTSANQDGSGAGVYARRYDRDGFTDGAEFLIPVNVLGAQDRPAVAANALGDFVVVWQSQPTATFSLVARRFAVDNAPQLVRFANGGVWRLDADVWSPVTDNAVGLGEFAYDADGQAVYVVKFASPNPSEHYLYLYREDGTWVDLGVGRDAIAGRHAVYVQLTNSTLWSREYSTGQWRNVTSGSVVNYDVGVSADGSDQLAAVFENGAAYFSYGPTVNPWQPLAQKVRKVGVGPAGAIGVLFSGNHLWRYVVGGSWANLASNVNDFYAGDAACRCFQVNVVFEGGFTWRFYRGEWSAMTSNIVRVSKPRLGVTTVLFVGNHLWRAEDDNSWRFLANNAG